MSEKTFSATEVKNRFGQVLQELSRTGGPIIVQKDNKPVAVILTIDEYNRALALKPLSFEQEEVVLGSFGMWAGRPDTDDAWLANGRSRWRSEW